jgi:HEAT repeat protein
LDQESEKLERLFASLNHPDKARVRNAVETLIRLVREHPYLVEHLQRLLVETDEEKRWPIAYVLGHVSEPPSLALNVLLESLGTTDPDIRWAVTLLLIDLGKRNWQVVEHLVHLLRGGTPTQRRMAVYCLRDLDLTNSSILLALHQALHDQEPLVRVAAVIALGRPTKGNENVVTSIIDLLLHDPDSRIRCAAAVTLAQLGEPAAAIRAALGEAGHDCDLQVQKACRTALDLLQKKAPVPPTR